MKMISRLVSLTAVGALAAGLAGCMHAEDPVVQYTQRSGKLAIDGGNAPASNLAIQMIDPWPRVSANRRIPAEGQRMSDAYERYRDVNKQTPRPIINPVMSSATNAASGAPGGATAPK